MWSRAAKTKLIETDVCASGGSDVVADNGIWIGLIQQVPVPPLPMSG